MTETIKRKLAFLNEKAYRSSRRHVQPPQWRDTVSNLKAVLAEETPLLYPYDNLGFNRSTDLKAPFGTGNVTPNYGRVMTDGFDGVKQQILKSMEITEDAAKLAYGSAMLESIDALLAVTRKYKNFAKQAGNEKLYKALSRVPHKGATSFYEALVFMKISIYFLRCANHPHLTLGRFDQYMYPFYEMSKAKGVSDAEIFEQLEEFFIAINTDTDLYPGVQRGDNGQSMVLGGFDRDGNSMYNTLSQMCMEASLELKLIDPKINLRVGKNTPDELFVFATELTKAGLGFPQYCNDDVVVPGLVKLGYDYEDALDYAVAACWEFIIPNCGADVPNITPFDFPVTVNRAITEHILTCDTFEHLLQKTEAEIARICDLIVTKTTHAINPAPPLSVYIDGCIETLTDLFCGGGKYNNYGCHGAGIANATDALAAVKLRVYDEKAISKQTLLDALQANFEGYPEVRNLLRSAPKMGNNDAFVNEIASCITTAFAANINGRPNDKGGIWRAGTGSAMEYIRSASRCPATADGRKASEPYSSSYSPALDVKTNGLLSVIQSFTQYDFTDIINGGPLTIEIHDSVLKNDVGIQKTAMLVRQYILQGGHQLQINAINRQTLLDAQAHPEKYPNLIVRVWGWSGYFNELDLQYQNHIIRRLEYTV